MNGSCCPRPICMVSRSLGAKRGDLSLITAPAPLSRLGPAASFMVTQPTYSRSCGPLASVRAQLLDLLLLLRLLHSNTLFRSSFGACSSSILSCQWLLILIAVVVEPHSALISTREQVAPAPASSARLRPARAAAIDELASTRANLDPLDGPNQTRSRFRFRFRCCQSSQMQPVSGRRPTHAAAPLGCIAP